MGKGRIVLNYIEEALRTESNIGSVMLAEDQIRLLHAGIGMSTESGEFLDALKKHIYYGKELDRTNLKEEIGDLCWYIAIALDVLGSDFETEMKRNIDKLQHRYPEKFTSHHANNRDLSKERSILENNV